MDTFKQYRRKHTTEIREVNQNDISDFKKIGYIPVPTYNGVSNTVSISDADLNNGSPKIGDMIARNPKDYSDQWLIAEDYFKDNFEKVILIV